MSYTESEIERLKECLSEILEESYFSQIHEMRKKLTSSQSKQQEQQDKVEKIIADLGILKDCHDKCHKMLIEFRNSQTQTTMTMRDIEALERSNNTNYNKKKETTIDAAKNCKQAEDHEVICIDSDDN